MLVGTTRECPAMLRTYDLSNSVALGRGRCVLPATTESRVDIRLGMSMRMGGEVGFGK